MVPGEKKNWDNPRVESADLGGSATNLFSPSWYLLADDANFLRRTTSVYPEVHQSPYVQCGINYHGYVKGSNDRGRTRSAVEWGVTLDITLAIFTAREVHHTFDEWDMGS